MTAPPGFSQPSTPVHASWRLRHPPHALRSLTTMIPASHAADSHRRRPRPESWCAVLRLPRPNRHRPPKGTSDRRSNRATRRKRPKSFLTRPDDTHPSRDPRRRKASRNFRCHLRCYQIVKDLLAAAGRSLRIRRQPANGFKQARHIAKWWWGCLNSLCLSDLSHEAGKANFRAFRSGT